MRSAIYRFLLGLTLVLGVLAAPASSASAAPSGDRAPQLLVVGAELVATRDVALRDAQLQKGSRVRVVKVALKDGQPHAVSLELPDGYVLRGVSARKVRQSFRRSAANNRG